MSRKLLALAALSAVASAGCITSSGAKQQDTQQLACQAGDVPGNYLQQIAGDFTSSEFAELAHFTADNEAAMKRAGFVGGRFSYWKEIVGKPPFPPPANVLCEALEFANPEAAAAYVAALDPAAREEIPGLAWLPEGSREIEAVATPAGAAKSTREFLVRASGTPTDVYLVWLVTPSGRFVQTTYVGASVPGSGFRAEAEAIHDRLLTRTAPLTGSGAP